MSILILVKIVVHPQVYFKTKFREYRGEHVCLLSLSCTLKEICEFTFRKAKWQLITANIMEWSEQMTKLRIRLDINNAMFVATTSKWISRRIFLRASQLLWHVRILSFITGWDPCLLFAATGRLRVLQDSDITFFLSGSFIGPATSGVA